MISSKEAHKLSYEKKNQIQLHKIESAIHNATNKGFFHATVKDERWEKSVLQELKDNGFSINVKGQGLEICW